LKTCIAAHRLPSSRISCDSVTTRMPVMPADWISPLARCNRSPTTAPARPCRGIGIMGSSSHVLVTGAGGSLDGAAGLGIAIRPNAAHIPFVTNSSTTSWQFFEPGKAPHTTQLVRGTTSPIIGYQSPHPPLLGLGSNSFALGNSSPENISGIAVPSSFSAPEPGTFSMLAFGLALLMVWRNKRRLPNHYQSPG
jgi:hypothetical protein